MNRMLFSCDWWPMVTGLHQPRRTAFSVFDKFVKK